LPVGYRQCGSAIPPASWPAVWVPRPDSGKGEDRRAQQPQPRGDGAGKRDGAGSSRHDAGRGKRSRLMRQQRERGAARILRSRLC